ncbi:hypothetical protein As57867_003219, partial [Aphanomyces stellatus]
MEATWEMDSSDEDDSSDTSTSTTQVRVTASDVVGVDGFLHASYFDPTKYLRTRDGLTQTRTSLISAINAPSSDGATSSLPPHTITASDVHVNQAHRLELLVLDHVLTADECAAIVSQAKTMTMNSLTHSYTGTKRQGDRLLTLDQPTADLLWVRLHAPLADVLGSHGATSTPLGFGVSGQWSLAGINPAMRVNAHTSTSSFFGPHYDAQRVASGHERALFSVIVYLNENEFEAGETAFHFPKKTEVDTYGMTVDEEIAARGGLAAGYTTRQVVPKVGRAVVFSQHVLHEALHATSASDKLARYVLRTDIMVTRPPQPYKVPLSERPSYNLVLEYFRRAQQHELQGELEAAGDLYERCLAIRYRFPASDDEDGSQDTLIRTTTPLDVIPPPVLELVGLFLDGSSLQSLVLAFPAMHWLQVATTAWAKSLVEALSQDTPLPFGAPVQTDMDVLDDLSSIVASSDSIEGTALWTAMHSAVFFDANVDGCCRVAALKTFFALGHT